MSKLVKFITVFLVVVVVFTASFVIIGQAANVKNTPDYTIMVISDTHVLVEEQVGSRGDEYLQFDKGRCGKMFHLSQAIFTSTMDMIIEKKPDCLLISGDISDISNLSSHYFVAAQLRRLTAVGIDVFVVAGNHDTRSGSSFSYETDVKTSIPAADYWDIPNIYAEFGYNQAIARDPDSNSYVAEMGDKYRLIAMDPDLANSDDELAKKLIKWSSEQTAQAVKDGKIPIGMVHEPILDHYGEFVGSLNIDSTTVSLPDEYRDALLKAGMNFVFTGHLHSQDIMTYENEDGVLYDIETASLANFPMPVRVVESINNQLHFSYFSVDKIPEEYLPDYLYPDEKAAILADFMTFSENFLRDDLLTQLTTTMPNNILSVLGLFGLDKKAPDVIALSNDIMAMITAYEMMPLYKKDAQNGKPSVEAICNSYGITDFPESRYTTVGDLLLLGFLGPNYAGDENAYLGSVEEILFHKCLYTVFYALADFDLFGKMHEIDENIDDIDLMPSMEQLFKEGKLELVDNNLLSGAISSLELIRDNDTLKSLIGLPSQDILNTVIAVFGNVPLVGIKFGPYFDKDEGVLLFDKLYVEVLYGKIAPGTLVDFGPDDNNLIVDLKTLQYE